MVYELHSSGSESAGKTGPENANKIEYISQNNVVKTFLVWNILNILKHGLATYPSLVDNNQHTNAIVFLTACWRYIIKGSISLTRYCMSS